MRRDATYLRVTWHDDSRVFVVSHWRGEVCLAATRIPVDAAPDLIGLFVNGLSQAAQPATAPARPRDSGLRRWVDRLRAMVPLRRSA